jgi:predicted metal-dependent hydrolase
MDYHLVRSDRRTVALVVDRQGRFVVRAPKRAALEVIERFVALKKSWIERKISEAKQYRTASSGFQDGELFWFLGNQHPLRVVEYYRSRLGYEDGEFILSRFYAHKANRLFEDWYRQQATQLFARRAAFYAEKMGVTFSQLKITGAATRWGSCSSKGTVNFSWRLVLAPLEVIDYVVVHELAHLVHHNHSAHFWRLVGQYAPHFRSAKIWLNRKGRFLAL